MNNTIRGALLFATAIIAFAVPVRAGADVCEKAQSHLATTYASLIRATAADEARHVEGFCKYYRAAMREWPITRELMLQCNANNPQIEAIDKTMEGMKNNYREFVAALC